MNFSPKFFIAACVAIFLFPIAAVSQTQVSGHVLTHDHQPIPFANVFFKGSSHGAITSEDGSFVLSASKPYSTLTVSYIGYQTKEISLTAGHTSDMKIILEEGVELKEVLIVGKPKTRLKKRENPAYRIMKKIWSKRNSNGLAQKDAYHFQKYSSTEIGLSHIDRDLLKKILKKNYDSIVSIIRQDKQKKSFYVPVFLREKIEKVYGNNRVKKNRTILEAEKEIGIQQQGYVYERISNVFKEIDIYENTIPILNKTFVSPLSNLGFGSYDYVLHDSTFVDSKKHYKIYFFPREEGDLVFQGNFTVVDEDFAIKSISMQTHRDINLNLVRNLFFKKTYIRKEGVYIPETNVYEADFSLLTKSDQEKGLYVKRTEVFEDYEFDSGQPLDFFDQRVVKFRQDQFKKNNDYWFNKTPQDIRDSETETILRELKENRRIKNITGFIRTLSSGYVKISNGVELGPLGTTIGYNDVEGIKLSAGFRTFKTLHDRFRLRGRISYGFTDKKVKQSIGAKYLLSYVPRLTVGVSYLDDTQQMGSQLVDASGVQMDKFVSTTLISRGKNYFLTRNQRISSSLTYELAKNTEVGMRYSNNQIISGAPQKFSIDYLDTTNQEVQSSLIDNNLTLYFLYTPNRNIFGYGVDRKYGKNPFSTLLLSYQKGLRFGSGKTNYDKIYFLYNQPIQLGKFGVLNSTLEAGKLIGTSPLPLLIAAPANQTYSIKTNTFALLNYYDFVVDAFVSGHFDHHFNGLIMNRIPLIKKLKIRSLVTFKGMLGSISESHTLINRSSITYKAPTKLYYEYGFGFENIGFGNLKIFRVDGIWRNNHQKISKASPKFGMRFGIKLDF